jgi:hypothetical protein
MVHPPARSCYPQEESLYRTHVCLASCARSAPRRRYRRQKRGTRTPSGRQRAEADGATPRNAERPRAASRPEGRRLSGLRSAATPGHELLARRSVRGAAAAGGCCRAGGLGVMAGLAGRRLRETSTWAIDSSHQQPASRSAGPSGSGSRCSHRWKNTSMVPGCRLSQIRCCRAGSSQAANPLDSSVSPVPVCGPAAWPTHAR